MSTPNIKIPKLLKDVIPAPTAMIREGIIVLAGVLMAAYVISRFPALKKFVGDASIKVDDTKGNNYY